MPADPAARYHLQEVYWQPSAVTGPRRGRTPARIQAYVPAPLQSQHWAYTSETVAALGDAQRVAGEAEQHATQVGIHTIARQLLRSESVASSQIEGVSAPGHRSLAKTEIGERFRPGAMAALGHINAVTDAYRWAITASQFSPSTITTLHEDLARDDPKLAPFAGKIRETQNWIGRSSLTPVGADFIPPPADDVPALLTDLCGFLSRSDLPPVAQAAIAHAQFETIHPFGDGNGRVGRALIGTSLVFGKVCRNVVPPVSLVLARDKNHYVEALTAFRFTDHEPWLLLLAEAIETAAYASIKLADAVSQLQTDWSAAAGKPRAGSAAAALLETLPAHPMVDISLAASITGVSDESARLAITRLEQAGVLEQVTVGKRHRVWESVGLFALVDAMERELSGGVVGTAETSTDD